MALTLVTSDLIHGLDYSKLTGTITTWNQNTTGNAGTVTNGVYTVGNQTIGGAKTFSGTLSGTSALLGSDFLANETSKVGISFGNGYGQINAWGATTALYGGLKFQLSTSNGNTFNPLIIEPTGAATFSGNVGIGTNSIPSDHKLQIHNALSYSRFALSNSTSGSASGDGLKFQLENLNAIIKNQENGYLTFGTNGRETDFTISSSGQAIFGSTTDYKIGLNDSAGTNQWWLKSYTNGSFAIHENNVGDKFTILAGGSVGIGTTSPSATLHVNAPATTAPSLTMGASAGQIFENEDLEFAFGLNNASPYNGWMQTRFNGNAARNFAINPLGGNVGIGTNSPSSKLHIRTSTNFNYEFEEVSSKLRLSALNDARSANIPLQFAASEFNFVTGNVGIVNTSPYEKLTIDGGNIILGGASDNYSSTRGIYFRSNFSPNGAYSGVTNATRNISIVANVNKLELNSYEGIDFYTSYTQRMSILTNGNVGIKTTSPTNLLHLAGTSATPSLRLGSVSVGYHWDIGRENATTGDFVFINTVAGGTPSEKLRIASNGDATFSRRIYTKADNGVSATTNRAIYIPHGGAGTFTFDFNPITLFSFSTTGGFVKIEAGGWSHRFRSGYIYFQNAGGGGDLTTVSFYESAGNGSGTIAVGYNGTNNIRVTFSNWHSNGHAWYARVSTSR